MEEKLYHKIRRINGYTEIDTGDEWCEISEEEYRELKDGGYEECSEIIN